MKRNLISIVLTITIIVMVSCQKETTNENISQNYRMSTDPKTTSLFQHIGAKHNSILYAVGEYMKDTLDYYAVQGNFSEEEKDRLASRILSSFYYVIDSTGVISYTGDSLQILMDMAYDCLDLDNMDLYVYETDIPEAINEILHDMPQNLSINDMTDYLFDEIDIIMNATTRTYEDTCVAVFLSVYANSLLFWDDAYTNINNPWHNYILAASTHREEIPSKFMSGLINFVRGTVARIRSCFTNTEDNPTRDIIANDAGGAMFGAALALHNPVIALNPWAVVSISVLSGAMQSAITAICR